MARVYERRLICCMCGADLGSADDPYRDPDCLDCLRRQWAAEAAIDEESWQREQEAIQLACHPTTDHPFDETIQGMTENALIEVEEWWQRQASVDPTSGMACLALSMIQRLRRERSDDIACIGGDSSQEPEDLPF